MSTTIVIIQRSGRYFIGFIDALDNQRLLPKKPKWGRWVRRWTASNCPLVHEGECDDMLQIIAQKGQVMDRTPHEVAAWFAQTHTSIAAFLLKINQGYNADDPHVSAIRKIKS